nr:MAG TPA: hypothetical protein [Caudoviricetes sp.]
MRFRWALTAAGIEKPPAGCFHRRYFPKFVHQNTLATFRTVGVSLIPASLHDPTVASCVFLHASLRGCLPVLREVHDETAVLLWECRSLLRDGFRKAHLHHAVSPRSGTGKVKSLVKRPPPLILPHGLSGEYHISPPQSMKSHICLEVKMLEAGSNGKRNCRPCTCTTRPTDFQQ